EDGGQAERRVEQRFDELRERGGVARCCAQHHRGSLLHDRGHHPADLMRRMGFWLQVQIGRLNTLGPFGPPTMHSSVIAMNRPCSTTPVTAFNDNPSAGASAMPSSKLRSRTRLPLSVT